MMHYNLEKCRGYNLEKILISLSMELSRIAFDGMSYQDYLSDLHSLSDKIINYLETRFEFFECEIRKIVGIKEK